jgi:hypothetical protein
MVFVLRLRSKKGLPHELYVPRFEQSASIIAECGDFDKFGRLLSANRFLRIQSFLNRRLHAHLQEAQATAFRLFSRRSVP